MERNEKWEILVDRFHKLGGIAENIHQINGENGRGIFPINKNLKSRIFIPSNLMIRINDIYLRDGKLRIKENTEYTNDIKDFFNFYQENFSWGSGGRETTESFERGLKLFPDNLKKLIKQYINLDLEDRHKGDWDQIIKRQFLKSRQFNFNNLSVICPLLELVNHKVQSLPFVRNTSGIGTPFYSEIKDELTHYYGYASSLKRAFDYGFFSQETIIFSLPFNIFLENSGTQLICKGLDIINDEININKNGSKVFIEGLPIASIRKSSVIKSYFNELITRTNLSNIPNNFFSIIKDYNISRRKEISKKLKLLYNCSSKIINQAINYELDSISQV